MLSTVLAMSLAACSFHSGDSDAGSDAGSPGTGTARNYALTDFSAVELAGSDDVDIRVGTGFSVRAEGPAAELDLLRIEKSGDTLSVGRKKKSSLWWNGDHKTVKVFVTMPRIARSSVAGSGTMAIDRVEGQSFKSASAGSGKLAIATVNVQRAEIDMAGSGDVKLGGGTAGMLSVHVAGSGDVDAQGLRAQAASIDVVGSGNVHAHVSGPAKVAVMGSGDVDITGGAKCSTSRMGSGEVRCG